ncbi:GTPase domain-containing protein [Anaerolineae bacterium CFX9]|nr:GTPase domain-containing protein [Anaerolineae bacterium CFX9]
MTSLVETIVTAIFGQTGRDFLNNLTQSLSQSRDSLNDFVYVRISGLPFIVLGARQTGKTTLIEWLRSNVSTLEGFDPAPTAPGGDHVGTFSAQVGSESMRLRPTRDVGGEYAMWETDWTELFQQVRPRGLIFLIDHQDVLTHKDALNFIMNLIEEDAEGRRNLKAFTLLVNKSDLWEETTTLEALMNQYSNEIRRLNNQAARLGYKTAIYSTSIVNGIGVDAAMKVFFNQIRPKPKMLVAR